MRRAYIKKNVPDSAINTVLKSIAPSTMVQYNSSWKLWWDFCVNKKSSPLDASIADVLAFFQFVLDSTEHNYGTLNSHRAALTFILPYNVSESKVIKRFFRGVFRSRPSAPKYNVTWDSKLVLDYLAAMPVSDLKSISKKLAVLLALATGQRLQTLALIKLEDIKEDDTGLRIFIPAQIKTSAPNRPQPCLELPFFRENSSLCVASLIKDYIERTATLRAKDVSALFISFQKPFGPISKKSLSRWVREVLGKACVDTTFFQPHSVRHASTSKAFAKGASLDEIRKAAGWSASSAVFARFYNRPVVDSVGFLHSVFSKT